jgi:hypothetical protein
MNGLGCDWSTFFTWTWTRESGVLYSLIGVFYRNDSCIDTPLRHGTRIYLLISSIALCSLFNRDALSSFFNRDALSSSFTRDALASIAIKYLHSIKPHSIKTLNLNLPILTTHLSTPLLRLNLRRLFLSSSLPQGLSLLLTLKQHLFLLHILQNYITTSASHLQQRRETYSPPTPSRSPHPPCPTSLLQEHLPPAAHAQSPPSTTRS